MVQMLHIPIHCDHDTCSISVSSRKQIRITNPYIKMADLRWLGPVVHSSPIVSKDLTETCVIASHGSSGHFSFWQKLHHPHESHARCFLCPAPPASFLTEAVASFVFRRVDHSTCIVIARAYGIEIWCYPSTALSREASAAAHKGDENNERKYLVASVSSGPDNVTAMASLQFQHENDAAKTGVQSADAAVHFVIGYDNGSLSEFHVDVWALNPLDISVSDVCWMSPPARSSGENYAVKYIRPWHHGSCMFVVAWADSRVQVFASQSADGPHKVKRSTRTASAMHSLCPGTCCVCHCDLLADVCDLLADVVCLRV